MSKIIESDLKINDVVVPNVSFSHVQVAIATLPTFLKQQHNNVSELRSKILYLEKSITISYIQESHQTTIDSYFGHEISLTLFFY